MCWWKCDKDSHSEHEALELLDQTAPEKDDSCKMKKTNECAVTTRFIFEI
jgi:hypothetical protein